MFGFEQSRNKKRVLAILDRISPKLTQNEIVEARELIVTHEQPGAAMDMISNWLYEHQVEISKEDYDQIRLVCKKMNMPCSSWEILGAIMRE